MSWLLGQLEPAAGWEGIVATYGPFAPFALLLLVVVRLLWTDNKAKEAEIKRLTDAAIERMIPLVLEATRVLAEAVSAMKEGGSTTAEVGRLVERLDKLIGEVETLVDELRDAKRTRR